VIPDNEIDPQNSLGPLVETASGDYIRYIACDDVVELLERVDQLLSTSAWQVTTLDRTNDGKYYSFLTRTGI